MDRVTWVFAEEGLLHDTGRGHPERAERLVVIHDAFNAAGIGPPEIAAENAPKTALLRVHSENHVETIQETCAQNASYPDPDTHMVTASWDAALLAAGAGIAACKAVLDGDYAKVFSACRPPGHHAERDRAMGFCLFNNVAVAARWLQAEVGLKRVAILDWDVHHGNGTQHAFYDDASVYYVSLHQYPHYPGTGRADERGANNTNWNFPMPPGTPAEAWIEAVGDKIVPELENFDPDFFLISCGFDAHRLDPLGGQRLEAEHFAEMTRMVKHLANGRVVSLLEGGYHLDALAESAVAHFQALGE